MKKEPIVILFKDQWLNRPVATKETTDKPSMTVQGETMTIAEMFAAHGWVDTEKMERDVDYVDDQLYDIIEPLLKPDYDLSDLDSVKQVMKDFNEALREAQKEQIVSSQGKTPDEKESPSEGLKMPEKDGEKEDGE